MKIIDLLNKIANGEESINVETKYDSDDWVKDDLLFNLYKEFEHKNNYEIVEFLNDYVEIIEESKKAEIPKHIPNDVIQDLDRAICPENVKCIAHKVNEIINYLQHKEKQED